MGRLPERCVAGYHTGEASASLCSEIMVQRKNGQARTEFHGLDERHAFEDAFLPGFSRDGENEGSLGMRRGHGHRPIPELRVLDPCHSDREGRNVKMDDMTVHDFKRSFSWIAGTTFLMDGAPLFILPHDSNDFALDLKVAMVNEDGHHAGVGRTEFHAVIPPIILFDRCFIVDEGHHGLSVFSGRLLSHNDEITVQDPVFLHGIPFDQKNKVISLTDHGGRDFDHINGFHGLDGFSGSHSSEEGKLETPGFHRADHFDGPLQVLSARKTDIAFPLQGFEIGGDGVIRGKAEVGANLFKTRRPAPVMDISGYKTQKVLLFSRKFHLLSLCISVKLTVLIKIL